MQVNNTLKPNKLPKLLQNGFVVLDTEGDSTNKLPYWTHLSTFLPITDDQKNHPEKVLEIGRIDKAKEVNQLLMLKETNQVYSSLNLSDRKAKQKVLNFFEMNTLPVFIWGGGVDEMMINNLTGNEEHSVVYDVQNLFKRMGNPQCSLVKAMDRIGFKYSQVKGSHSPKQDANATAMLLKYIVNNIVDRKMY